MLRTRQQDLGLLSSCWSIGRNAVPYRKLTVFTIEGRFSPFEHFLKSDEQIHFRKKYFIIHKKSDNS